MINQASFPYGVEPTQGPPKRTTTTNGVYTTNRIVAIQEIKFPEFGRRSIPDITADVFNSPTCRYDVILGRDILSTMGLRFDFEEKTTRWLNHAIPMRNPVTLHSAQQEENELLADIELLGEQVIKDRKYEAITADEVVAQQHHLTIENKKQLRTVLARYSKVFDGQLGCHPTAEVNIELKPGSHPVWIPPYRLEDAKRTPFYNELNSMIEDKILVPTGPSEWGFPSFIIPKKDGRVRWISDFRELNKMIVRKPFPLPRIQDILLERSQYKYFTKIDLSMMFYCFRLSKNSQRMCVITTPKGCFAYTRLPMGVKISPDVAQYHITNMLQGIDCSCYMDDVGIWTNGTFEEHLQVIDKVLSRFNEYNMKCNPLKCEWAVKETDFLGFWMTPTGVKPWKKRIEAILRMAAPANNTDVRAFIGAVNHYKSLWPRRAHILAPLAELTGRGKFVWTERHAKAFAEMKAIIAADAINTFPDHNKPYHIYTDASDLQLGAAIIQNGKPIAYFSKKLSTAQQNYNTTEKELLAIVLTLREYQKLLVGAELHIYTDHKNLTFKTFSIPRIRRWRLFIDQFDTTMHYVAGVSNVLADCFSRLPRMEQPTAGIKELEGKGKLVDFSKLEVPKDEEEILDGESFFRDNELADCFLNLPPMAEMYNPITIENIVNHQAKDVKLQHLLITKDREYQHKEFQQFEVICHLPTGSNEQNNWKIVIPHSLSEDLVRWYHLVLGHCGIQRLKDTVQTRFYIPGKSLQAICTGIVNNCPEECQKRKRANKQYGHLPPRQANLLPWNEVAVDLIGPWTLTLSDKTKLTFRALTCIDPVTNLMEAIRIRNKTSKHVAEQFANSWLARYPRPMRCIFDNGGEFVGKEFRELLTQAGIAKAPTTVKNPQSNAICERMHGTMADILKTIQDKESAPENEEQANQIIDNALATCVHALRCAVNHTMQTSPGALVFSRDMIMEVPLLANLDLIRQRRQELIDINLLRTNKKRINHDFAVGEKIYVREFDPAKLEWSQHGPYQITRVYTNGTVDIQLQGTTIDRINIRKLVPCRANK